MAAHGSGDLLHVVALLGAAVVAVPVFKRLGLGSVLGYLAAGLVIGPYGLKLFDDPQAIIHVAELGVVMFLFIVGLEMQPSHLWALRRQIFGLGSMQVVLAAVAMTLVGMLYGFDWRVSFVCAAGFVLTSTAIVMQVLGERQEISTPPGQQIVSILLFEDLLIVPLLAIVNFLAPAQAGAQAAGAPSLWVGIGIAALALGALVAAGLWLLNPLFRLLARHGGREIMTAAALLVVLGAALLMEMGGLSTAMGAFVAGVLLSESSFRHQLEADIEPFRGLLLGLFFLGVGMALDLRVVAANWWIVGSGVLALMAAKAAVIYGVARLDKSTHAEAVQRALLMAQGGEFAFVLFSAAAAQGVINARVHANMTAIVVLSMALTPLFIALHTRLTRCAPAASAREGDAIEHPQEILIAGHGRFGQIVNDVLLMAGYKTTVIDMNAAFIEGMRQFGVNTYYGDATRPEILHAAGLEKARLLIIAVDGREQALRILETARGIRPDLPILARAYDRVHGFALHRARADRVVRETFAAAVKSSRHALQMLGVPARLAEDVVTLYAQRDHASMRKTVALFDTDANPFTNKRFIDTSKAEDAQTQAMIRALLRGEAVEWPDEENALPPLAD